MRHHIFRLLRGADLYRSIRDYAVSHRISAGYVACCVGCVSAARVRDAGGATVRALEEPLEIVSVTGTVSAVRCHIHIAFSREDLSTIGGHLMEGCTVNTTAEVVLCELDNYSFDAAFDNETGYEELLVLPVQNNLT